MPRCFKKQDTVTPRAVSGGGCTAIGTTKVGLNSVPCRARLVETRASWANVKLQSGHRGKETFRAASTTTVRGENNVRKRRPLESPSIDHDRRGAAGPA